MTSLTFSRSVSTALVLALATSSAAAQSLLSQHGEVLIGCGEAAPGIAGAIIYANGSSAFGTPVLDANGTAAFRVRLDGAITTLDNYAIYVGQGSGDLTLVARAGDEAPGLPGIWMRSNTAGSSGPNANVQISPFGEIVYFSTSLSDDGATVTAANDSAYIWGQAGGLLVLAREGDPVPFLPSGVFYGAIPSSSRQFNTINASGSVVFTVPLTGAVTAADDLCIVTGAPGSLVVALREGDDVDGVGGLAVPQFGTTMSYTAQINDIGQILIDGKLGGTATASNDAYLGIYNPGGGVFIIAREGDQAPGMAAGVTFTGAAGRGSSSWDNSGNTAFNWTVTDGGVNITADNDQCTFYGGLGGIVLVAQENDSIGLPGGERFAGINNTSLTSNSSGTLAFFAGLRDAAGVALPSTADSAMFLGTPGNWTEIVREGDVIAAIPPTVNGPWTCLGVSGSTNLNALDQLLFNQSVTDGVDVVTLFLIYDAVHGLQIVRDQTETYTSTVGTGTATSSISYGGGSNGDGCPNWFNNNGDFVFRQSIDNSVLGAVVRGHSGMLVAKPASFSIAAGGSQTFVIDAGPANAFNLYALIGAQSGTRPGTIVPPLGALTIPLNFDSWTSMTLDLFNTPIYTNTLWFTDVDGKATASFNLPPGLPLGAVQLHHAAVGLDFSLMETFVTEAGALRLY